MKYLARDGSAINRPLWARLLRQPEYTDVCRLQAGGRFVTASWLGWVADSEEPAMPFVVTITPLPGEREVPAVWFATEDEARRAAERIAAELESCAGR